MNFNWEVGKEYENGKGEFFRILATDGKGVGGGLSSHPIIAMKMDHHKELHSFKIDGRYLSDGSNPELDLVPPKRELFEILDGNGNRYNIVTDIKESLAMAKRIGGKVFSYVEVGELSQ